MRAAALGLNTLVVLFFGGFLAYICLLPERLESHAREFVTEKTLAFAEPIVSIAEEALAVPLVASLMTEDQIAAVQHEIDRYRLDPAGYVADLTRMRVLPPEPGAAHPLLDKVRSIKVRIRTFYDETLQALMNDLRIFAGSNLVAGLIALWLAYRSRHTRAKPVLGFSLLLFAAVLYCSWMYVDDLTFFRILFRMHMGWWYPVLLAITAASLHREYGLRTPSDEREASSAAAAH